MANPPTSYGDHFEAGDQVKCVVARFSTAEFTAGAPSSTTNIPFHRFPAKGRVVAARLIPHVSYNAGTVNYTVGLYNMLQADPPAGTIQLANQVGPAAAGGSANRPVAFTIQTVDGRDIFASGDWLGLNVTVLGAPSVSFSVEIDFRLDAF